MQRIGVAGATQSVGSTALRAVLITGTPGSGKTSVAQAIASQIEKSAHIPVDFFRKMVKGGYRSPHMWDEEVDRQCKIARRAAADAAVRLALGGFTPIIDDVVCPGWEEEWRLYLLGIELEIVLLSPRLEVALKRNQTRECWTVNEQVLSDLYAMFDADYTANWLKIDNSEGSPHDTAAQILSSLEIACRNVK